jgi:thiamine pyrophosphate-dependent acetolactate synthase large subunit-like protein
MRVADAIVEVLEDAGVDVVFGIPGVHNLSLFDALESSPIRVVVTRHEGAAAHAADGFARATGRVGVALTTTGPGTANALGGFGEAWAAGSPVLLLTTQVRSEDLEAGIQRGILHQSPGQLEAFRLLSRSAGRADREAPTWVAHAIQAAQGRSGPHRKYGPGPAYVEVPFDVLDAEAEPPSEVWTTNAGPLAPSDLGEATELLDGARAPIAWAGGGVVASGAFEELARVAERLAAPVVTTYLGRTAIPASHPLAVAVSPHEPAVRRLLAEADVLLAVGTDFGATVTMGGKLQLPERIVRIDVDPDELQKHPATVQIQADAREALAELDEALAGTGVDRSSRLPEVTAKIAALRDGVGRGIAEDPRTAEAGAFLAAMEAALPPEAIVVCDMCVAGYWCGGYLPRYEPRTLLYPLGWGTLGFGLPAAVGAAASRRVPVVAVVGDAGLMYYPAELATALEHDLDVTVLCVNDRGYGMLRFDQQRRFGRTFAVDLFVPDLERLAASFDVPYALASIGDGSLERELQEAVAARGPRVIEVRAALYPPRTTSPRWDEPA